MNDEILDAITDGGKGLKTGNHFKANRREAKRDPENAEQFTGMLKVHRQRHEETGISNHRYKVLWRWLEKQVGRSYNDVYSEVAAMARKKPHMRDRLIGEIDYIPGLTGERRLIYRDDGSIHLINKYFDVSCELDNNQLYVDKDSIIRRYKTNRRKFEFKDALNRVRYIDPKDPTFQYHEFNGIWYVVYCRQISYEEREKQDFGHRKDRNLDWWDPGNWESYTNPIIDTLENHIAYVADKYQFEITSHFPNSRWQLCRKIFGSLNNGKWTDGWSPDVLCPVEKRQLNSKEIKKLKQLIAQRDK